MTAKKRVPRPSPVAWFEVLGKDGGRLRSFCAQLFGWHTADVAPGAAYGVTDASEHGVGGGIGQSQDGGRGHVTFFVEVDDLDEVLRHAERLGGKTIAKAMTFPDKRPSAGGRGSGRPRGPPRGPLQRDCSAVSDVVAAAGQVAAFNHKRIGRLGRGRPIWR